MGFRTGAPAPDIGYNRTTDWPTAGGVAGTVKGGKGMFSSLKGTVSAPAGTGWHPTVAWLMGFVVAELIAFHLLSKYLNL